MIRMTLVMAIAHQGLVVVAVISSVEGGRPKAGLADLKIRHLVPDASWGDIVGGENRAACGHGGGVLRCYFDEGIVKQLLSTHTRAVPGNLKILSSGSEMAALWCRVPSWGIVHGAALEGRGKRWRGVFSCTDSSAEMSGHA